MVDLIKEQTIYVDKVNESFLRIYAEAGIYASLNDFFAFYAEGYKFMPAYRIGKWDGRVRLFSTLSNTLPVGLLEHLEAFAKERDYEVVFLNPELGVEDEYSLHEAEEFSKSLKLHANREGTFVPITAHDYQVSAFRHCVQKKRCILLSPTASGKSLIIYHLIRHYQTKTDNKILIIVPTTSLVSQLYTDFGEYSWADTWDVREECHMIMEGKAKNSTDKQVYISTWQSIYKQPKSYFDQFDCIIGDEAHGFKANSLTSILNKSEHAQWRFGTTGTLDGTKVHKLVLEGLFGRVHQVTTTKKLQEAGTISDMMINCLMLYYPEDVCKAMKESSYVDEVKFLIGHKGRNSFIRNLALSMKGNTLVLYQLVEKHGKPLHAAILAKAGHNRKVFFVSGKTETEDREEIRRIIETEENAIIVASYGTFSTGINIRRLNNIIFASPYKSRIKILQSLGRGLRLSEYKDMLNLYDISDILQHKSHKNHTMKHFVERMSIYASEEFSYKMFKIKLGK